MWVLGPILGSLFLILFFLLVPVDLAFSLASGTGSGGTGFTVKWLFGLVHFRISPKRKEQKKPAKKREIPRMVVVTLRTPGFVRQLLGFCRDILHIIHVRWLLVDLKLGLFDPADTGMLSGAIIPVMNLVPPDPHIQLNVQPDFQQPGLKLQVNGEVRVYPLALAMPTMRFVFSMPTLRMARTFVAG